MGRQIPSGANSIWVEDSGGTGAPVVLAHPGITDSTIWERLIAQIPGRRFLRFDRPGYGQSPRASAPSSYSEDLLGVLDACGIERAHLVGNSMGGGAAVAAALQAPDRVASLTLLCPAVPGYPWPEDIEDENEAEYRQLLDAADLDGLTDLYLRVFAACGTDDYLRAQVRATTAFELSDSDISTPDADIWDTCSQLRMPASVILGERDEALTNVAATGLAGRLSAAEIHRLDADHLPQYRLPKLVASILGATMARA